MSSEYLEELMIGYVLNTLSPTEVEEVEKLLQQQPELSQELAKLEEVMTLMAEAAPRLSAPTALTTRIREITATDNVTDNISAAKVTVAQRYFSLNKSWYKILLGFLGLLTLYFAFNNYSLRQKLADLTIEHERLEESQVHFYNLRGTKVANTAIGNVILDFKSEKAYISVQNLPPLPQGKLYHLWAFTKDKKILCGQFNTSNSGATIQEISIPVAEYDNPILFMRLSQETPVKNPKVDMPKDRVLVMTSET